VTMKALSTQHLGRASIETEVGFSRRRWRRHGSRARVADARGDD
jgi:hypothetical protein